MPSLSDDNNEEIDRLKQEVQNLTDSVAKLIADVTVLKEKHEGTT